jgi:CDP-diacylglycerol--glycerol-3-phosphate 3-phosphatidyltransferase
VYLLATALLGVLLVRLVDPGFGLRWAALAALALLFVLSFLFRALPQNRHPSTQVMYPTLGLANQASLLRGVLLAWLAGFLFSPRPEGWLGWLPGLLYTAAIVIDYLDGLLARLTRRTSLLGQRLDTELDALGILVAPALGMWWGQLPPWYVLVALAYYAFMAGRWLRRKRGLPVRPLPPSSARRAMAGIQMGFISAALWPVLPPALTVPAATLVMLPFVAGFLRDWLAVSGWDGAAAPAGGARLIELAQKWLPLPLRLAAAAVMLLNVVQTGRLALYEAQPPLSAAWLALLALLVLAGAMGRTAATLLAIFAGIAAARWGVSPASAALIACGLSLMLLGSGALSLWRPEEAFLQTRYGGEL